MIGLVRSFSGRRVVVLGDLVADEFVYGEIARVLKPGGILGVVQHRAAEGSDPAETAKKGYVSEAAVKAFAAEAGLTFEAA